MLFTYWTSYHRCSCMALFRNFQTLHRSPTHRPYPCQPNSLPLLGSSHSWWDTKHIHWIWVWLSTSCTEFCLRQRAEHTGWVQLIDSLSNMSTENYLSFEIKSNYKNMLSVCPCEWETDANILGTKRGELNLQKLILKKTFWKKCENKFSFFLPINKKLVFGFTLWSFWFAGLFLDFLVIFCVCLAAWAPGGP